MLLPVDIILKRACKVEINSELIQETRPCHTQSNEFAKIVLGLGGNKESLLLWDHRALVIETATSSDLKESISPLNQPGYVNICKKGGYIYVNIFPLSQGIKTSALLSIRELAINADRNFKIIKSDPLFRLDIDDLIAGQKMITTVTDHLNYMCIESRDGQKSELTKIAMKSKVLNPFNNNCNGVCKY